MNFPRIAKFNSIYFNENSKGLLKKLQSITIWLNNAYRLFKIFDKFKVFISNLIGFEKLQALWIFTFNAYVCLL